MDKNQMRAILIERFKRVLESVNEHPEQIFVRIGGSNISMAELAPEVFHKYTAEFLYSNVLGVLEELKLEIVEKEDENGQGPSSGTGDHEGCVSGGPGDGPCSDNDDAGEVPRI